MPESPFLFFFDPILRGPTLGSMMMCLAASLVGVLMFLRKQSLVGEVLSHAAYPGVIFGVIVAGLLALDDNMELNITLLIMCGASLSALIGLWTVHLLEFKLKIRADSALCFVLSTFFGIGVVLASDVQFSYTSLYRQAQAYLYGQAATMTDIHIALYGILSLIVVVTIILFDKELQTIIFAPDYAKSLGINVNFINAIIFFLTVLAVIIGIRSVGVILMSAMFIAPAVAARQYTNRFHMMLILAAFFGLLSGYFGNYLSVLGTYQLSSSNMMTRLILPTGPMIVIVASAICILSLLFAPERGLLYRIFRIVKFRYQCARENIMKSLWKLGQNQTLSFAQIAQYQSASQLYLKYILLTLVYSGWLVKMGADSYQLTSDGFLRAARIVRLHRLWEVYLADYLGAGADHVHHNAEEMEHIITPELENELTLLLKDPQIDPHQQWIPPKDGI